MFAYEVTNGQVTNNTVGEIPACFTSGDDFIATMIEACSPWCLMQKAGGQ